MAMQQQNAFFARMKAERAFTGDADPEVADRWICELEKIFAVLGCSPEKRLAYAVYMLVEEVEHWWRGAYQMLVARGVTVDWDCFRMVFMEKYFPESAISEAWKCKKFAEGLKYELKKVVVLMAITEFPILVEKAKIVERLEGGNRVIRAAEGPAGSKRGSESQRKPDCPHTESRCFRCQQMGHVSFNCPTRSRPERSTQRSDAHRADTQRSSVQRTETQRGDRPTTAGRVFALTGAEASTSSDLMKGKGKAADCANRRLIFPQEEDELLISASQAESWLRDG
ncbi:uncharacterized protein LOC109799225 [Cajanus cajan]|uniref:uncharacterized protein LOC109799225 n=1 Tax=Cajanus cajan TaxID=3821 RepID=UPI00098DB2DA|nr:uncharacterized protein LOC109799225 [Cajanus cajan]